MGTKHQFTEIPIDERYTEKQRRAIAEDFINYIRERTQQGKGPGGRPWSGSAGKYSKSYLKSWRFKAAGTAAGKSGKVNLTLSGDMLESIERLDSKESSDTLVIGYEAGSEENAKADGNIRGTYGKSRANRSKARPFLELTKTEINRILKNHPVSPTSRYKKALELREEVEKIAAKTIKKKNIYLETEEESED